MRTKEEIQRQINGLNLKKEISDAISQYGYPIHEAIDAQIAILENAMLLTADAINKKYVYEESVIAFEWLHGLQEDDDDIF